MNLFLQLLTNGLVNGALFAVLACAFGLIYRSARVFHIAFAGIFLIAPYAAHAAKVWLHCPVWLAIGVGISVGCLAGYASEVWLYRPFMRKRAGSGAVMVASLGAYIIIENVLALLFGNEIRSMDRAMASRLVLGPVALTSVQVWQFSVCSVVLVAVAWATSRIRAFKIIWAMGDEPELVPALGLPIMRYRALVFVLSAGMAGLAGCLIGWDVGVDPHMGMSYLLIAAVAVLAGGIDRYAGWVIGGFILAILQSLVVWKMSAKWMDLMTFALLIGVLMFRPQGLLGLKKRLEEG